jgi:DNA-binding NtrC family response regulator
MKKILIIDDDDFIRKMLASVISKAGFEVYEAPDGETGLKYVEIKNPDLVITDFKMPGISGLEVVTELVRTHPGLPVIMLTAYGDVSLTIKAIQSGAYDYIEKPIKNRELIEAIYNGIQASIQSKSLTKIISPEARKAIEDSLLAGKTPAMREIFKNIGRISLTNVNVMITGEAGTGKEQIARLIHYSGITREQPFVVVNCNSASEEILEHELFGYSKATSGGMREKKGKIELAEDGTLFLDEFQELTPNLQNSLLRVIQNNEYVKGGEDIPVPLKCRIITSTKSDIESLVSHGKFLQDLYFRLRVFTITLPPLRERIDDIPELLQNLLQKLNRKLNKRVHKVEDGVTGILKNYEWPGNIRELENILMQAIILSHGDVLERKNIILTLGNISSLAESSTRMVPLTEIEKEHIKKVLDAVGWNKMEASTILEITRPTLNAKIEKYGLKQT